MKNKMIAYCASRKCAPNKRFENKTQYAIKDVHISTIDRKDCGCVLIWKKDCSPEALAERKRKSGKNKNSDFNREFF